MTLDAALQEHFGFAGFRPGQREACEAALEGRDVLLVMPTGSGKSLCYQLPALLRDDLTIVVSPLVALMADQVQALHALGLGDRVALVNAQQDAAQNNAVLDRAVAGDLRLLYVAPERFSSPGFLERIGAAGVGLFVVDEAHCVSQWGHDFRPDYFRLADAARHLEATALFASTATATTQVALDIARRLRLEQPVKVATGFDRPNISFAVARPAPHEKRPLLVETLRAPDALPAIVYAGTRKGTQEIADQLSAELGVEALAYHAGLERGLRAEVQNRFIADEAPIVVATNAFGMGVDKPNVRTVLHASCPGSLEAYYQEAGRGGRDGKPARALLLAEGSDKARHVHFIKREEIAEDLPRRLYERLVLESREGGRYSVGAGDLARSIGCDWERMRALIGHLSRAGVLAPSPAAPDRMAGRILTEFDAGAERRCRSSIEDGARARWRQYREIWAYVELDSCRRAAILRHFGDRSQPAPRPEGVACCDGCDPGLSPKAPPRPASTIADLDDAIVSVAGSASPAVGRTTCVEIVHGARTKKIERNSFDGLPAYGTQSHLARKEILARVDELIESGELVLGTGPYPVLSAPPASAAA